MHIAVLMLSSCTRTPYPEETRILVPIQIQILRQAFQIYTDVRLDSLAREYINARSVALLLAI
jgi:hypothetical protein